MNGEYQIWGVPQEDHDKSLITLNIRQYVNKSASALPLQWPLAKRPPNFLIGEVDKK